MEEQIKFIADYLNGCRAIFSGKNLQQTDMALTMLTEIETELKKLRVADVMRSCTHENKTNYCNTDGSYSHKVCDDCNETLWD